MVVSICFNMFQIVSNCFNMFQYVSKSKGVSLSAANNLSGSNRFKPVKHSLKLQVMEVFPVSQECLHVPFIRCPLNKLIFTKASG